MKRIFGVLLLLLIVAAGTAYVVLTQHMLDLPVETLRARYATPNGKLVEIDGVQIQLVDEGPRDAPGNGMVTTPLLLLNASFNSLRSWDAIVPMLTSTRRVVRFDTVGFGLSGLDPNGDYSTERQERLIEALADKLGLARFVLVATSSGATTGFRYAGDYPARVERLVLINSAGMPRTSFNDPNRVRTSGFERWLETEYRSAEWWRRSMQINFPSMPVPEEFYRTAYDINRRDSLRETAPRVLATYQPGGPRDALAKITAPTLILWGMKNPTVMHLEADVFEHWLTAAPSLVKKYPELGHYPYVEAPQRVADDILAFADGKLDGELRRTERIAR